MSFVDSEKTQLSLLQLFTEKGITSYEEVKNLLSVPPYNCKVKDNTHPDYFIISYDQIRSDFTNPVVQECRGIILDKETLQPVCLPFYKFFNYGESNATQIEWKTAVIEEKLDGSLMKVWYCHRQNRWIVSSNKVVEPNSMLRNEHPNFHDIFMETAAYYDLKLEDLTPGLVYLFELCHPKTQVVILHDQPKLFHLSTRCMKTLQEKEVDIGIPKPQTYHFGDLQECVAFAKDLPKDQEGFVVRDINYHRIKIKGNLYVKMHHFNGKVNCKENLIKVYLDGEKDEVLNYFPDYANQFEEIDQAFQQLTEEILGIYQNLSQKNSKRKDFAIAGKLYPYFSVLMQLYVEEDKTTSTTFTIAKEQVVKKLKLTDIKKLLPWLYLKD